MERHNTKIEEIESNPQKYVGMGLENFEKFIDYMDIGHWQKLEGKNNNKKAKKLFKKLKTINQKNDMKITKEQIKKVEKGELNMRELFPEVFSFELEVGKWYKDGSFLVCFQGYDERKSFGFDLDGWNEKWIITDEWTELKPATKEEVEKALKKEFKKKYKGKTFTNVQKDLFNNFVYEKGFSTIQYVEERNSLYVAQDGVGGQDVFLDGKWAEIIEEDIEYTLSDAMEKLKEFHKGKKVTIII